jgi:hypothetical protein
MNEEKPDNLNSAVGGRYAKYVLFKLVIVYIFNFLFALTSPMWIVPAASTINDLVMPRMRAIASAFYLLMVTFTGLALGPYTIGFLSDSFVANGSSSAKAVRLQCFGG